ncbi:MAG: N-acetyl-gamma-glutamyl-phosphate reductase [bacterium]
MLTVGIIGATGYAGSELVRILVNHKEVDKIHLVSKSYEGKSFSDIYGSFNKIVDFNCQNSSLKELSEICDVVFLAMPHGIAAEIITDEIITNTKIIDLGADFRIDCIDTYEKWYEIKHKAENLINKAIYGLCELNAAKIKDYSLVANPGCYTTCSILSLAPALKYKLINTENIIIDAKSGVSGAGRSLNTGTLYCESNENLKSYKVASHRHTPEIEQELSKISGENICLTFTPHLVPMQRGILTTSYTKLKNNNSYQEIYDAYKEFYQDNYFIRVLENGKIPETRWVKNSNFCDIGLVLDKRTQTLIIIGAIDNLIKGASGQAVQNMNILFGFDEKTGLDLVPSFI